MKCMCCNYDDNGTDKFVGIFAKGVDLSTSDGVSCALFGCPQCGAVCFTTDAAYIKKRKEMYKQSVKEKAKASRERTIKSKTGGDV